MPNHCESDLIVGGPKEDVTALREFVRDSTFDKDGKETVIPFSCTKIIPYPAKYTAMDDQAKAHRDEHGYTADCPRDGFNSGGYQWCCDNWGTKWGCYEFHSEEESSWEENLEWRLSFSSAWSPPLPVIEALAAKFPNVSIRLCYFEQGMAFNGFVSYSDGELDGSDQAAYYGNRGG